MALGAVVGPAALGWVAPDELLRLLAEIGVILLLGMAGLHIGLDRLMAAGRAAWWLALLGIALPLGGGYFAASWWGSPQPEALYVGTALVATSIGISVQALHQIGLLRSWVGEVVVAAAVIDDVIALYLLAVAHDLLTGGFSVPKLAGSLVVADLGFRQGHLDHHVFVTLILVAVSAAVTAPVLITLADRGYRRQSH